MTVERFLDIGLYNECFKNNDTINSVDCNFTPWLNNSMYGAFYNCVNLKSVSNINENVTNMTSTFSACNSLVDAPVIPSSVTRLYATFSNCHSLVNAPVIPNCVTGLPDAFAYCNSLVDAPVIPNSVTNMCWAFRDCTSLVNAPVIPNSVTDITGTFFDCNHIVEAPVIPDSVTNMYSTFRGCSLLNNVPEINVPLCTSMYETFRYCFNLTDINVKAPNCTNIKDTFANCTKLANVYAEFNSVPNIINVFHSKYFLKSANISAQSSTNAMALFYNCYNLTNVSWNVPNTTDMSAAFYYCNSLENPPVIPNSMINMKTAFSYCTNMIEAPVIPNSVTNLYATFEKCNKIENAPIIPDSVTNMEYTFCQCSNLNNISNIPNIPNGVDSLVHTFSATTFTTAPNIPNSVTNMWGTFDYCYELTTIPTLPNNVSNMVYTFFSCNKLQSIPNLPASVTNMYRTFHRCMNLGGNIFIHSNQVSNAVDCFNITTLTKNVYIPFEYENGVQSATYNSFDAAYPKSILNGTIQGTLTNNDGVVSGFSSDNYVWVTTIPPTPITSIEEIIKIHVNSITSSNPDYNQQTIVAGEPYLGIASIHIFQDGRMRIHISSNGTTNDIANGIYSTLTVNANTDYWVKLIWDGSTYILSLSTDGANYTDYITINSNLPPAFNGKLGFGNDTGASYTRAFEGSIDFNNTYVKINGQKLWEGYIRPNGVILKDIDGSKITINPTINGVTIPASVYMYDSSIGSGVDLGDWTYTNSNDDYELQTYIGSSNDIVIPTPYIATNNMRSFDDNIVMYKVSKEGCADVSGSVTVNGSKIINVPLTQYNYTFAINTIPSDATVTINSETRNSITGTYGTEANWSVSKNHYVTKSGAEPITSNSSKFVELALDKHSVTLNVTPNDATVKIMVNGKMANASNSDWVFVSNKDGDVDLRSYIGNNTDVTMPTTFNVNNETIYADYGSTIEYEVSKEGYHTVSGTFTLTENTVIPITLVEITYGVDTTDYNYTLNNGVCVLTEYIGEGGDIETPEIEEI